MNFSLHLLRLQLPNNFYLEVSAFDDQECKFWGDLVHMDCNFASVKNTTEF